MTRLSENIRGALVMTGAMAGYTVNDAFMKLVLVDVPLFEAIFLRGIGTVLCLLIICRRMIGVWRDLSPQDRWMLAVRTSGEVVGTYFFLAALREMPIANVSAVLQVLPLSVALAAAVFLREPLGWRRLLAIAIGFLGVMLIIRPGGADFSIYSLYALGTVACVTVRDVAVRRISRDVPAVLIALFAAAGVMCLGAVGTLWHGFVPVSGNSVVLILGATVALMFGYVFSVTAMRWGEISFVAPFRYSSLVVALILGLVVFGDWPDGVTLIGASIVVATGLFTLYRETRAKGRHVVAPPLQGKP